MNLLTDSLMHKCEQKKHIVNVQTDWLRVFLINPIMLNESSCDLMLYSICNIIFAYVINYLIGWLVLQFDSREQTKDDLCMGILGEKLQ